MHQSLIKGMTGRRSSGVSNAPAHCRCRSSGLFQRRPLLLALLFFAVFFSSSGAGFGPTAKGQGGPPIAVAASVSSVRPVTDAWEEDYVYKNLEELNEREFGSALQAFSEVNVVHDEDDANDGGDDDSSGAVPSTVPTHAAILQALQLDAAQRRRRTGATADNGTATSPTAPALQATRASLCVMDFTCPRSSMAWASGTFTVEALLTPHSLTLPVGLELKLSLCCRYRFDGTLLRDAALYDGFLAELLHASPFQVLTVEEKREMFPQSLLYLVDTWERHRVYNASYVLSTVDAKEHNDGDGDVLVLTTGALSPQALRRLVTSTPSLMIGREDAVSGHMGKASGGGGDDDGTDGMMLKSGSEVQLRITNRVLKCKCPHTLMVMPLLHVGRDVLPPIRIVGLGAHCGTLRTHNSSSSSLSAQGVAEGVVRRESPHGGATGDANAPAVQVHRRIRKVWRPDGTVGFAVSFEVAPPVPLASLVTWTVLPGRSGPLPVRDGRRSDDSLSEEAAARPISQSLAVLQHVRFLPLPEETDRDAAPATDAPTASAALQGSDASLMYKSTAASPYFMVEPHVRYRIFVRVSRYHAFPFGDGEDRFLRGPGGLDVAQSNDSSSGRDASVTATVGGDRAAPMTPIATPATSTDSRSEDTAVKALHVAAERTAQGTFVLRLPLNRTWALPPVRVAPHFGFRRRMRLTNETTAHTAVRAALDPFYNSTPERQQPPVPSVPTDEDGAGWLGVLRRSRRTWSAGDDEEADRAAPVRQPNKLNYYGFWENVVLDDQPLPQHSLRVLANPYGNTSSLSAAAAVGGSGDALVPLFLGRNLITYLVRDVDDVCEPVLLEEHDVWAVQSHLSPAGPVTACAEQQNVSALILRGLLHRMRVEPKLWVTVPNTTWSADPRHDPVAAREGLYKCVALDTANHSWVATAVAFTQETGVRSTCEVIRHEAREISGVYASLRMRSRGVYQVVWVARVVVHGAWMVDEANLDPLYTRVTRVRPSEEVASTETGYDAKGAAGVGYVEREGDSLPASTAASAALFEVEVASHALLVVRRIASYPDVVAVELPMHARQWTVPAPRALTDATSSQRSPGQAEQHGSVDILSGDAPTGYWRSQHPVYITSTDEQLTAELDTNAVPNLQETLPPGTLQFTAMDSGELMSVLLFVDGATRELRFTSQCPDTLVEFQIHVWAAPLVPMVPAYAPIYTEDACVVLVAPREVRKDEVAAWQVPPCTAARQQPYLVQRTLSPEEQEDEETQLTTTAVDGGEPLALSMASEQRLSGLASDSRSRDVVRRAVTVQMVCGIEAHRYCEVVWSVHNSVAEVHKTFSLRRCQRPPDVLFHKEGIQQRVSYPPTGVFAPLPTMTEVVYHALNVTHPRPPGVGVSAPSGPREWVGRQRRLRHILPIAGYTSTFGYSFNYTKEQDRFELQLHPLWEKGTHQLWNTQHEYVEGQDGAMVLRRYQSTVLQPATGMHGSSIAGATGGGGRVEVRDDSSGDEDAKEAEETLSDDSYFRYAPLSRANSPEGAHGLSLANDADEAQRTRDRMERRHRDEQLDAFLRKSYVVMLEGEARRLRLAGVGNASLLPMDYTVRASASMINAVPEEDRVEFLRRGMGVERLGYIAVLAVNPRGSVEEDGRYGTSLPPPPPPAVAVLPFCAAQYSFFRFPELSTVYRYDFTWRCAEEAVVSVEKRSPTHSVLYHTPERRGGSKAALSAKPLASPPSSLPPPHANATVCELSIVNHITLTEQRESFLVKRVFPSPLSASDLVVLSHNAATSLQFVPSSSKPVRRRASSGGKGAEASAEATRTIVTMKQLYAAPPQTFPFGKSRRIVGKSAVVHLDAPADPLKGRWAVTAFVPATFTTVGSKVVMEEVTFLSLPRYPAAVARGKGGSTVLVKGLHTPGLYTLTHTQPDPENPNVCPPVALTEMLDVFHAQVREKELFVCGDTAALQAVPVPAEMAHEFVGRWEVVSLATDVDTVWTAADRLSGIRFERASRAETLVHGLPFGVVTMRWAVYRVLPNPLPGSGVGAPAAAVRALPGSLAGHGVAHSSSHHAASATRLLRTSSEPQQILVDYDTVEVFVLTENLHTNRLVTLADRAAILVTSSTQNWRVDMVSGSGSTSFSSTAAAAAAARVDLTTHTFRNFSSDESAFLYPTSTHADAADADGSGAERSMFRTYYGVHPRPGSGVLTLQHLPVGTVHLRYDLLPSRHVFGKMVGHTCALQGHYEVERVSAYLTAATTMDHECDSYTGRGRITLCLHTEAAPPDAAVATAATAARTQPKSPAPPSPPSDTHLWQSQVRLISPEKLEETVKQGARALERYSGGHCVTPWWVAPGARWSTPAYTTASTATAASTASLPGRCVSFTVTADRHLSYREVLQPLFVAVPRYATALSPPLVGSAAAGFTAPHSSSNDGEGDALPIPGHNHECPFQGAFLSIRIIDGASSDEAGDVQERYRGPSAGGREDGVAASIATRLGLSQLLQRSLPYASRYPLFASSPPFSGGGSPRGGRGNAAADHDGGGGEPEKVWGIRFLPVLQPTTLRRSDTVLRPMMGLQGVQDDVVDEVDIGGWGHQRASRAESRPPGDENSMREATVLLRLDLTAPRQRGGYPIFSLTTTAQRNSSVPTEFNTLGNVSGPADAPPTTLSGPAHSLLYKCVEGTVRGADVFQYWTETNRPDGRVDRTAQEWLDYAYAMRDATVPCDVLFGSLGHLVSESYPPSTGPALIRGSIDKTPPATPSQSQRSTRRQQSTSPHFISLAEMEEQVDRIRKQYRWTPDGIDVTGLPEDLQRALSRRRVTTTQLRAIEAARRSRQEAEAAASEMQQRHQRELQDAPIRMSPAERLVNAVKAYQGVAQGSEVAVLRIRLPRYAPFTVPYDMFLRTALHKDVVCGTAVDLPPAITNASVQPTVPNPSSLVPLGRLEVRDVAPELTARPPVVKQCEIEGGIPVVQFELRGANFHRSSFEAEDVTLTEIENPEMRKAGLAPRTDVGLTPCLETMRRGLRAVVEASSRKRLYLQLSSCPAFRMLTPEEYNEHQDSRALLRRLKLPRYLRITVHNAIQLDSFLNTSPAAPVTSTNSTWDSWIPGSALPATITTTSTDVVSVIEVLPTLARLHLHSSPSTELTAEARKVSRVEDRGVRQRGLGSRWWGGAAADEHHSATTDTTALTGELKKVADAKSSPRFEPSTARPLVLCEADLRRYGFQLGIELVGDVWAASVGSEEGEGGSDLLAGRSRATPSTLSPQPQRLGDSGLPRQRAPANVALLNSFSVVEHHSLDSSHNLYMKGGGVYRSHFMHYIFTTLLGGDPTMLHRHRFVRRYNATFVVISMPPQPAVTSQRGGMGPQGEWRSFSPRYAGGEQSRWEEAEVAADARTTHSPFASVEAIHEDRGGTPHPSSPTEGRSTIAFPDVRQFPRVEEILFAVPGIATECQGCLVADTTFLVAGDLTGVWTAIGARSTSTLPVEGPVATGIAAVARPRWTSDTLLRPLVLPWDSAARIPRLWQFDWVCPSSAHDALERLAWKLSGRSDGAGLSMGFDVVLYRLRDVDGTELPSLHRPTVLLTSNPVELATVLRQNRAFTREKGLGIPLTTAADVRGVGGQTTQAAPLLLKLNESAVDAGYTRLAEDVLRHRRRAWTELEYHRDMSGADGLLVVNASVFLKVCISDGGSATTHGRGSCTVVAIADALLAVEPPRVKAVHVPSWWWPRWLPKGRGSASTTPPSGEEGSIVVSPLSIAALAHHALLTFLVYELLPFLGVAVVTSASANTVSESFRDNQQRARTVLTTIAFLLFFFAYAYAPRAVWMALVLGTWSLSLYYNDARSHLELVFLASIVYAYYLL